MANSEGDPLTLEVALLLRGLSSVLASLVIDSLSDVYSMGCLILVTLKGVRFLLPLQTQWNITSNTSGFTSYSAIIPISVWSALWEIFCVEEVFAL